MKAALERDLREGEPAFDRMRDALQTVKRLHHEQSENQLAKFEASSNRSFLRLIFVLCLTQFLATLAITVIQRKMLRSVGRSQSRLREVIGSINEGMFVIGSDGRVEMWNDAAERLSGRHRQDILNRQLFIAFPELEKTALPSAIAEARRSGQAGALRDLVLHLAGQGERFFEARIFPFRDSATVFFSDVTEHKRVEGQLVYNALHDALTGLPNRALFMDRLTHAVERAKRHRDFIFAVLFIDLDRFKLVNDSLGHLVGDQLLVRIARRLTATLRPGDTLARLGGDEFTILLDGIENEASVASVAERLKKVFAQPFDLGPHQVFATASIGITLSTASYEKPEDLLRNADTAMYRAKSLGKDRHEVFDDAMHEHAIEALQLETDLRLALEREEFRVHYQPIVSIDGGAVVGYEALLRWQHPERGLLLPGDFLSVVEETGLIISVGWWVLEESCRQMRQWQEQSPGSAPLWVSVNISGKQLMQAEIVEKIEGILRKTGCAPQCLKLEITENVMVDNAEATLARLEDLRALGVQLSIDDFGTGYSSLSYIHRFPISTLKIDRSFINRIEEEGGLQMVSTIVMLARSLGMQVVAEGIETEDQLARLKELKCEYGQGFLFHRPMSAESANVLIEASTPVAA